MVKNFRHHPLNTPAMIASSGISVRLWRLYAQAWLVCLIFPLLHLVQTPMPFVRLVVALVGLALFASLYTWWMWPHPLNDEARSQTGFWGGWFALTSLLILVLLLVWFYGSPFLWLLVGVSAVIGVALPAREAFITVMGLTLLTLGLGVWLSGGLRTTDWLHLLPLVLLVRGLGLDMAGITRLAAALRELNEARSELARRAVTEERLRMARDLHDLLGHTLSLITLKSELAGRLIGKNPVQAAQEIQEVEYTAREALREVRAAIAGYRQPTLLTELDHARELLSAAGLLCVVEQETPEPDTLPPDLDAVLAWVVREGVTNVIRHSRARECRIRLARAKKVFVIEITNDGNPPQESATQALGSGLTGLSERVTAQGGWIEAGRSPSPNGQDFRLHVEIPFQNLAIKERAPT